MPNPIPLRIAGSGIALPRLRRDNDWFDQRFARPAGWTARHVGIRSRPIASEGETSASLAADAVRQALAAASWQDDDFDVLISACGVGQQALPCTAALIHRQLGLDHSGIGAFDINASCLSFPVALDMAASALACGRYRRAVIVSSEIASAGLNWDDPDTAPLFGDGAAAVAIEAGDGRSQLLAAHLQTWSAGVEHCRVRAGGTAVRIDDGIEAYRAAARFEMDGAAVYRLAAQKLPGFIAELSTRAGIEPARLGALVPHQASAKALKHIQRVLRLPPGLLVNIIEHYGNQMSASIPTALHLAISDGRIQRGDTIALVGTGAGLSAGGVVLRY